MANSNRRKLQVFVSSTFSDLVSERQAAVEAVLTAGHIPAGMELFTAGDESQMEVIKQWIDESDVYLLILGGRYGSIEPKTGSSYTQLEYEYAISKGKPFFACVIKDESIETRVKARGLSVLEIENAQKLKELRARVLTKMCKFWEDSKDIKITITETLSHLARREDLVGWVRSSTLSDLPAIADEMARLSKENAQLRSQLAGVSRNDDINGLTFSEMKALLEKAGILNFIQERRGELALGLRRTPVLGREEDLKAIRELGIRGLVVASASEYKLSESGNTFMNRLEAEQLALESSPRLIPARPPSEARK